MSGPFDRRLFLTIGGGAVVLAVAVGGALFVVRRDDAQPKTPPPASTSGLVVQMGRSDDAKVDPKKPLRCFVNAKFVGLDTLQDCAQKNGVATEALDVGVDQTGALAAANSAGATITPLPPAQDQPAPDAAAPAAAGECWRYASAGWRKMGDGMALGACVELLFAGHCEKPGEASYGRWMGQTIRLVPHKVEISADNKNFKSVADQDDNCAIAAF
jgi:hypothetical protein